MTLKCPNCREMLPASQLNVEKDVAVCLNCDAVFSISEEISAGGEADGFDLRDPPNGAWFEASGRSWRVFASTRSYAALVIVPFMCVWSGFSVGGIYGGQLYSGEYNLGMSLFGIPFLLGSLLLGSLAAMTICGKVVVSVDHDEGKVFTGVGPFGWTRRFDWSEVTSVKEDVSSSNGSENNGRVISLVGQSRLNFGSGLSDARRYFVIQALRKMLANRSK